jgi:hypothetical protein
MKNAVDGAHCSVCKRALRNPLSVKLGIGPVCRARENQQEEFDFMYAKIQLLKHERGKYIFVRDIGHFTERTVTNDAEYIVEQLYLEFGITDETRIFYEDSERRIDELLHIGARFHGFKTGHEGIDLGEVTENG